MNDPQPNPDELASTIAEAHRRLELANGYLDEGRLEMADALILYCGHRLLTERIITQRVNRMNRMNRMNRETTA